MVFRSLIFGSIQNDAPKEKHVPQAVKLGKGEYTIQTRPEKTFIAANMSTRRGPGDRARLLEMNPEGELLRRWHADLWKTLEANVPLPLPSS